MELRLLAGEVVRVFIGQQGFVIVCVCYKLGPPEHTYRNMEIHTDTRSSWKYIQYWKYMIAEFGMKAVMLGLPVSVLFCK